MRKSKPPHSHALLSWLFDKPRGVTTPLAVQIVAVVQGLFLVMTAGAPGTENGRALWSLGAWLLALVLMTGFWNMKRWTVLALGALVLLYFGLAASRGALDVAPRGVIAGVVVRSIAIVTGLGYWKRMTWS